MNFLKNLFRITFFKALNYKVFYFLINRFIYLLFLFNNKNLKKKKINILLLSPYRFRDDIASLSNFEDINIIKFPLGLQYFLFSNYSKNIISNNFLLKENEKKNLDYIKKVNLVFENLLSFSLQKLSINFVASSALNYVQDAIYFQFFRNKKIKTLIIARENFGIQRFQLEMIRDYLKKFNLFPADLVFCQNLDTKQMYEEIINNKISKIISVGTFRMDNFANKINLETKKENKKKKNIVLFSFTRNMGINIQKDMSLIGANDKKGLNSFFKNSHNILIEFAQNNPEYNLYIKHKFGGHFLEEIKNNWFEYSKKKIPDNCYILSNIDPHNLILNADLVVSFNSSTLLESGLRDIPILIPAFDEVTNEYKEYFDLSVYESGFQVIKDKKNFCQILEKSLKGFKITEEQKSNRTYLFNKYLSDTNENATSKFLKYVRESVE